MCGEQLKRIDESAPPQGSPPRVRGTGRPPVNTSYHKRITPACAGNRTFSPTTQVGRRDHPRVCGEQRSLPRWRHGGGGSPPRVRGTARGSWHIHGLLRITPACAGNRSHFFRAIVSPPDHPRVCGEQGPDGLFCGTMGGSPPRVRGTGARRALLWYDEGITPACAGNSLRVRACDRHPQDHPRVCGEQLQKL